MAKGDLLVEFTKDYANQKKGSKKVFSRDLSAMLIKEGVVKVVEENAKKTKNKE